MILSKLLSNRFVPKQTAAGSLYEVIVAAARRPTLYEALGVPDTVDGRFDMIVLHLFVLLDRLKGENGNLQQALLDEFFKDMDRSLREMGVGDLSVGKKVRKMAEAYQGRMTAYRHGSSAGDDALRAALGRNVYAAADPGHAAQLLDLVREMQHKLAGQSVESISAGRVQW